MGRELKGWAHSKMNSFLQVGKHLISILQGYDIGVARVTGAGV